MCEILFSFLHTAKLSRWRFAEIGTKQVCSRWLLSSLISIVLLNMKRLTDLEGINSPLGQR